MTPLEIKSGLTVGAVWFLNYVAMISRDDVAFWLGVAVSISALIHYWVSIRKNTKEK